MTLTKAELVNAVYSNHADMTKPEASVAVESLLKIIKECLGSGEDLLLSGFGKFSVRQKKERTGRNPKTGQTIKIESRRVITFNSSGLLREKVNNG